MNDNSSDKGHEVAEEAGLPAATSRRVVFGSRMQRNPEMIFTDLDDTVVMMDADKGVYYELDPVGTRIWNLLETERSVDETCELLIAEYDVAPETCHQDVLAFLEQARKLGIIVVRQPATP